MNHRIYDNIVSCAPLLVMKGSGVRVPASASMLGDCPGTSPMLEADAGRSRPHHVACADDPPISATSRRQRRRDVEAPLPDVCNAPYHRSPTKTGSGTSATPNASSTPVAISRASATSSAVVPSPRLVSARTCLDEIAMPVGLP